MRCVLGKWLYFCLHLGLFRGGIVLYLRLYLPNAEMTLDLEVNEVEVKGLTSLASVTAITGGNENRIKKQSGQDRADSAISAHEA